MIEGIFLYKAIVVDDDDDDEAMLAVNRPTIYNARVCWSSPRSAVDIYEIY